MSCAAVIVACVLTSFFVGLKLRRLFCLQYVLTFAKRYGISLERSLLFLAVAVVLMLQFYSFIIFSVARQSWFWSSFFFD